jgi:hypothetical protein
MQTISATPAVCELTLTLYFFDIILLKKLRKDDKLLVATLANRLVLSAVHYPPIASLYISSYNPVSANFVLKLKVILPSAGT